MDLGSLQPHLLGGGELALDTDAGFRLSIPPTVRGYADAQVDDYRGLRRAEFPWSPPLAMTLRARASHPNPRGTLGFGFWNDPFGVSLSGAGSLRRLPATPQAIWFFYGAPPNDFSFAKDGIGHGWKAATLRSVRYPAAVLVPAGAAAFALGNLPLLRRWIVPLVRKQAAGSEVELDTPLAEWHEYSLIWKPVGAEFSVDGQVVSNAGVVPHAPLGFVAWIDNQYAVLTEASGIRFGLLATNEEYWLEVQDLHIERL